MKRIAVQARYMLAVLIAAMLAAGPAVADKPSWAGGGDKQEKKGKGHAGDRGKGASRGADQGGKGGGGRHFGDRQRIVIHDYYAGEFRAGNCPPGLAKKRNGCMPPGQAKKWQIGRPLPHDVVFYDLPPALVVQIGVPPPGHRYVRVAADILLIAVGTGLVVEAIQDLGRM
jgi:Ni/Co efflux regulator RcnB